MGRHSGSTRRELAALLAKETVATIALGAAAVGVSTLTFPAPASAKGSSAGAALVIKTEHVANLGTVLSTGAGLTLYSSTVDPAGKATCIGACAKAWPPLLLPKAVTHLRAPRGVKGLTALRVQGGRVQVFFRDHALYRFVGDSKKGEATGQGIENDWFAVLSDGKSSAAKSASSASSGTSSSTSTSTSTSTSATSPTAAKTSSRGSPPSSPTTAPPVTKSPAATSSPPATTPPATTPPTTTPPATAPPTTTTTTAPPTGGVGF